MITRAVLLVSACFLGTVAHFTGERAEAARTRGDFDDDLLYLPEGRFVRMASFGHRNFAADIVWLWAIQYYGEQRLTGQNYEQAERLFQTIYDLDPHFKGATRFGALVLAQDAGNPQGALTLLERAEREHPRDWEYPFDRGFIHHTVLRDYGEAADAYRRASELPGAPGVAMRLAGISFARLGDRRSAREVWLSIREGTDNELMRQIAERNLLNLDMQDDQDELTEAVARFRAERHRDPASWRELLAAGHLVREPVEPFGGMYYLDSGTGEVWSTTHIDRRMAQERDIFAGLVRQIREVDGAYPRSLDEVVRRGLAASTPWEPFGLKLDYDPTTGVISWNPPWPATEPGKHGAGDA